MLRTSSYTIYVDLPGNSAEVLLVHGYTGAYDRVSRHVATYLRTTEVGERHTPLHGEWSPEPPIEAQPARPTDATIATLKRRGYLTERTPEEEERFFGEMATKLHHLAMRLMPSYILMPTYDCNLRCSYCFQDHMRTDPAYAPLLRFMSRPLIDRIFEAMPKIEAGHGVGEDLRLRRNIVLFGGEPLMEQGRPTVEYIIEKAESLRETQFMAVTNATDLHAYRDLLGPSRIAFLQITLDGPPEEHDKRRVYADGSGSFERIARNIDMALELGVRISVRMNVDRNNIGLLAALGDEVIRRGWDKNPGFSSYAAPIRAANEHTDERTTFNSWELNQEIAAMTERHPSMRVIGGPDDSLMDRVRQIFERRHDPLPSFKASFCSAHDKMYIIDAFGDVYACWERTGDPSVRIGHVAAEGESRMRRSLMQDQHWRSRTVATNPACRRCRYAFYCGGGCAVLAEGATGKFYSNHCDGFGKRFQASAAQAYLDHVSGVAPATNQERVCDM